MASATQFSCFLFIVLYASSRQCSEARKTTFLSNYIHHDDENASPSPAPAPITSEISSPPASAPTLAPATPPESFDLYTYKTTYTVDDDNSGKEDEEFSGSDQELGSEDSGKYSNGDNFNSFSNDAFWGYQDEPQGMSDTRLVDNDNVKYYNNGQRQSYTPRNSNEEGYYYKNGQKSRYEFNSIEEYEKQEGYPDVQPDQFFP